jgi:pimeloyl-ACP methyl ester carboxylesterase
MYMAGYDDEDAFDRELAARMPLGDLVEQITCPVLYGIGEFDELTSLDQALDSFERIRAPKELRVHEDEFHPLGGVAAEVFRFGAEWLQRALDGHLAEPGRDVRHYVHRDGRTTDGTARPTWWLGTAPIT